MRLHKVVLENFGLFSGRNELTFLGDSSSRPITLIAGMNGAGKTTFLEGVQLALYGRAAFGNRVSQVQYHEHLKARIHRDRSSERESDRASVGIDFSYETMGSSSNYRITRSWSVQNETSLIEALDVMKDGEPLTEVDQQYWQDFVRELVPPGVSQLFFFDGEKIQRLADDEDNESVAEAIKSLLGLDLVERLHDDLSLYRERQLKKTGSKKALGEFETAKANLASVEGKIQETNRDRGDLVAKVQGLTGQVAEAEKSLTLQGGRFVENRDTLKTQKDVATDRLEQAEQTIRELAETALPFAFCTSLFSRLLAQLDSEAEARKANVVRDWAATKLDTIKTLANERGLGGDLLSLVEKELARGLPEAQELFHGLSADAERRLRTSFDEAGGVFAERLREASRDLEESTRVLQQVQQKLRQVPEEDALKTRVESLNDALGKRAEAEAELKRMDEELRALRLEQENVKREVRRAEEKLELDQDQTSRLELLQRCQAALDSYQSKLTLAKVQKLGEEVTACFHHLHRKGDLVHGIQVDPITYKVELFDIDGSKLAKKELSAGEKQMYAVAMLWGLALTSGRKLPLIIDTPLGRLDSAHRDNLVERYFPHAAEQVIILSTDTEIDKSYYQSLAPHISKAYRLEFIQALTKTEIHEGYFWTEAETCHA